MLTPRDGDSFLIHDTSSGYLSKRMISDKGIKYKYTSPCVTSKMALFLPFTGDTEGMISFTKDQFMIRDQEDKSYFLNQMSDEKYLFGNTYSYGGKQYLTLLNSNCIYIREKGEISKVKIGDEGDCFSDVYVNDQVICALEIRKSELHIKRFDSDDIVCVSLPVSESSNEGSAYFYIFGNKDDVFVLQNYESASYKVNLKSFDISKVCLSESRILCASRIDHERIIVFPDLPQVYGIVNINKMEARWYEMWGYPYETREISYENSSNLQEYLNAVVSDKFC